MTSPSLEVQSLIVATLKVDAAVMTLVNGVYDSVPSDPWGTKLGYISLGPEDNNVDDADCINGWEMFHQIDVWSRKPGRVHAKQICAAVKAALHHADVTLTDNALVSIECVFERILKDPDQQTTHGVLQFRIAAEEPSDG